MVAPPVAARWGRWAAAGSVVWSLRRVFPKTDHIAAPAVGLRPRSAANSARKAVLAAKRLAPQASRNARPFGVRLTEPPVI